MKNFKTIVLFIFAFSLPLKASAAGLFSIASSDIKAKSRIADKHVFNGFGCVGENISPQIKWNNAPKNTKSFAVTVYDPSAPTLSGWWHWALVNIPASYAEIPANFGKDNKFKITDDGVLQIRNDFGAYKFGGPCPPKGDKPHRYVFTVYALKVDKLDLQDSATSALASYMINQNTLAKVSFEAYYAR